MLRNETLTEAIETAANRNLVITDAAVALGLAFRMVKQASTAFCDAEFTARPSELKSLSAAREGARQAATTLLDAASEDEIKTAHCIANSLGLLKFVN